MIIFVNQYMYFSNWKKDTCFNPLDNCCWIVLPSGSIGVEWY